MWGMWEYYPSFLSKCICWSKSRPLCGFVIGTVHQIHHSTSLTLLDAFFPRQLQHSIRLLSWAMPGGLAACIQLLLSEWQLIKALSSCWRHRHYVIPLQGSLLLAMKHTATRALKTQTQTLAKLPLSSGDITSAMLLTEEIVTILTVCYSSYCISSPAHTTTKHWSTKYKAGSCIKNSHLIMRVRITIS